MKYSQARLRTVEVVGELRHRAAQIREALAERAVEKARARVRVVTGHLQSTIASVPIDAQTTGVIAGDGYGHLIEQQHPFLLPAAVEACAEVSSIVDQYRF